MEHSIRLATTLIALAISVVACTAGSNVPVHSFTGEEGLPAGSLTGILLRDGDCVVLEHLLGETYLLVWPQGSRADDAAVRVQGHHIGFGDLVVLGGGEVPHLVIPHTVIPDTCADLKLWLVSEVLE